jgi:hypothetical protein
LTQRNYTFNHAISAAWRAWVLAAVYSLPAHAGQPARPATAKDASLATNFRLLAQQRPWACEAPLQRTSGGDWTSEKAECAWQDRLRKQSWSWTEDTSNACVSKQARWWVWAHEGLPAGTSREVWQSGWSAHATHLASGAERRILMIERTRNGRWVATEWRWNPSPRAATRRWQEGRWNLLAALAAQRRQPSRPAADSDAGRLQAVFGAVLGRRPGELLPDSMALESDGLCLRIGNPLPGQPKLPLLYSPDDSRLEQRAAMHLLLSRQYPQASWLTPFRMITMPPNITSGAKFLATWVEAGQLKGQLWIPAKNGASTVRVRMTTAFSPEQSGKLDAAPVIKAKQVVERELRAIAVQWAVSYE